MGCDAAFAQLTCVISARDRIRLITTGGRGVMRDPDRTDRSILRVLQAQGRIANNELADAVGLSPSACLRRVRALEESGVIDRYVALLDPVRIGKGFTVFARVQLTRQDAETIDHFTQQVLLLPDIVECHLMV